MKIKKYLSFILILVIIFSLVACSKKNDVNVIPDEQTKEEKPSNNPSETTHDVVDDFRVLECPVNTWVDIKNFPITVNNAFADYAEVSGPLRNNANHYKISFDENHMIAIPMDNESVTDSLLSQSIEEIFNNKTQRFDIAIKRGDNVIYTLDGTDRDLGVATWINSSTILCHDGDSTFLLKIDGEKFSEMPLCDEFIDIIAISNNYIAYKGDSINVAKLENNKLAPITSFSLPGSPRYRGNNNLNPSATRFAAISVNDEINDRYFAVYAIRNDKLEEIPMVPGYDYKTEKVLDIHWITDDVFFIELQTQSGMERLIYRFE